MPTLKARVGGAWVPVLGGTGNEVTISPDTPTDPDTELWYDTDDVMPYWLPGGAVDTVPVKKSSADGDIQWGYPDAMPRGLIAWKWGAVAGQATSTTPVTIYTLAANLIAGRAYMVEWGCRAIGTSGGNYRFTSPVTPTIAGYGVDIYKSTVVTNYETIFWRALARPTASGSYTFTVRVENGGGTGAVWTDGGSGIFIFDVGLAVASS